ncbi:MAG: hypothetical protein JWN25_982 [Verrucomicrobiales bacterium]|nr:hypothetical protein [Verrucomicrobiales bacterium]
MDSVYKRNYFLALIGDGRPLLTLVGFLLMLSGGFALFLSATGNFLPHDIQFLGMTADALCSLNQCRVVHFMFHDRVAFGGSLIAIGSIYMWMSEFPLKNGEAWAWWLFVFTGVTGFGSFLAYLGYGYLDKWHGVATLLLLPCYIIGLQRSAGGLKGYKSASSLLTPAVPGSWFTRFGVGRACLLAVATGMICGGITIMLVGMTRVFVPQDLEFLQMDRAQISAINPRLIPLIAHDRAGFGGGVCSCGILVFLVTWCGRPSRSLWQVLLLAGTAGFASAIGVHPAIGYTNLFHLAPAFLGLITFVAAMVLLKKEMFRSTE